MKLAIDLEPLPEMVFGDPVEPPPVDVEPSEAGSSGSYSYFQNELRRAYPSPSEQPAPPPGGSIKQILEKANEKFKAEGFYIPIYAEKIKLLEKRFDEASRVAEHERADRMRAEIDRLKEYALKNYKRLEPINDGEF
jgi:hypothetical protein